MKVTKTSATTRTSPTRKASSKAKVDPPTSPDPHSIATEDDEAIARGGVATPFPWKLHEMLEDAAKEGNEWIVSWQSHGRSFIVHQPKVFVEKIMPTYFNQSKFASFQRQLNLYGFNRLTTGKDKGAYYHSCFVRGQRGLCRGMVRQKIKGTKVRRTLAPEEEPDFYKAHSSDADVDVADASATDVPSDLRQVDESTFDATTTTSMGIISSKERALKARQERLCAVRDVLKQTEFLCANETDFDQEMPPLSSSLFVPSVSPMESEESDSEETHESSIAAVSMQSSQKVSSMSSLPPMLETSLDSLPPKFTNGFPSQEQIKGGDLLFFEGKPFHYLEHLDSLPPPPTLSSVMKYSKQVASASASSSFYPRDSLQSLMRVDPQAIMGGTYSGMGQVP